MRLPRPHLPPPRLPRVGGGAWPTGGDWSRGRQAATAGSVALVLTLGVVVIAGATQGQPHGVPASLSTFSATPGWLTDPSTGPLGSVTPLPTYPAVTPPAEPLPTPSVPTVSLPTVSLPTVSLPTGVAPTVPAPGVPTVPSIPSSSLPSVTVPRIPSLPSTLTPTPTPMPSPTSAPRHSPSSTPESTPPPSASPSPLVPSGGTPPEAARSLAATLFGMHDAEVPAGRPAGTAYGTVRLWDTGTTWRDVQPTASTWHWGTLDTAVNTAVHEGAQPLVVLGQTPAWAADDPKAPGALGAGASSAPKDVVTWRAYVTAVAARYKGRGVAYEIWNQPDVDGFWTGTDAQLVELAKTAYQAIKAVDPTATVTTPSYVVSTRAQRSRLAAYLAAGGATYADAVNIQAYPPSGQGPESLSGIVRSVLSGVPASKPVWDTAVAYWLPVGSAPPTLDPATQAAYVARTYLVVASLGLERAYWYSWTGPLSVRLTTGSGGLTAAGRAYATVQQWLVGSGWRGCRTDHAGTWTCWAPAGRIVWNPTTTVTYTVPAGIARRTTLAGSTTKATPGSTFRLDGSPVLLARR